MACIWLQTCIGLMLFQSISCGCIFPEENLPNGIIKYQSPDDATRLIAQEMYVLQFVCQRGYTRIGSRYSQCIDNRWSHEIPTCAKMECPYPPDIENAEYVIKYGTNNSPTIGSSAIYECKARYELNNTNASTLKCVLGKRGLRARWIGEKPVCKEKVPCPDPGVSNHGTRNGDCCFSGDDLFFSCNEDYELVGSRKISCLPTGIWTSGRPLCRPLEDHCELPPPIPHGIVTGEKDGDYFLPEEEAEILCEPGYVHRGVSEFLVCEDGGEWQAEFGECTEIFCDPPDPIDNGTILELLTSNLAKFPYDFEITYICDEGYRLIGGHSWRVCGKYGWSGKNPYCEVIGCPDPGIPEHGSRKGDSFGVGSVVRFSCFEGYNLLGSVERFCKPNGQWTGELARCDLSSNYCPNPGIPVKGSKNSTNYNVGSKVGFICHSGYILVGSEVRECLPDKKWSGTETKCLGQYDFDSGAQVRDILKARLSEKVEEQEKELKKYREALHSSWLNGSFPMGRSLDLSFEGRIILYFAFDVSGSVGPRNFQRSIQFAKAVVSKIGISAGGSRAGAITFSSKAESVFLPLNFKTTKEVLNALEDIEYSGGGTAASSALHFIRTEHMPSVESEFGKKNIKSVIFILTDGKANMGGDPKDEANILKEAGVEIYCIGITGDVRKKSLYDIASTSVNKIGEEHPNVFILDNYVTLSWLVQDITNGTVDYSECGLGLENVGNGANRGRMVGGERSKEPWPWMAALYKQIGNDNPPRHTFKCGGSIIHRHFILTAAHCMYEKNEDGNQKRYEMIDKRRLIIKLGLSDITNVTYVQESDVTRIYIHPQYQHGRTFDYDIALLQVERPIEFNAFVRPICLAPKELPEKSPLYKPDTLAWATGWGHEGKLDENSNKKIKISQNLKELFLPLQSRERCLESLKNKGVDAAFFTDRMFCAGDGRGDTDTCEGDSGGPLMQSQVNSDGYIYWTQIGIVSWGIGCAQENLYGYYSHLQVLMPWLDNTIESAMKLII